MNQDEFNKLYDSLKKYAENRARRLFYDVALRGEAIDMAMDRVINWMVKNPDKYPVNYCKTIIRNSLYNSSTRRKIEPINLRGTIFQGIWGFRGRKPKD